MWLHRSRMTGLFDSMEMERKRGLCSEAPNGYSSREKWSSMGERSVNVSGL